MDKKFDTIKLGEALREILTNHQVPFKDRVREITENQDMYAYIQNVLNDLV